MLILCLPLLIEGAVLSFEYASNCFTEPSGFSSGKANSHFWRSIRSLFEGDVCNDCNYELYFEVGIDLRALESDRLEFKLVSKEESFDSTFLKFILNFSGVSKTLESPKFTLSISSSTDYGSNALQFGVLPYESSFYSSYLLCHVDTRNLSGA